MRLIVAFGLLFMVGCSGPKGITDVMHDAQKQAIASSPYNTARTKTAGTHVKQKDKFAHFPPFLKKRVLDAVQANDTVRILESYDLHCGDCPSFQTQVQIKDTIYTVMDPARSTVKSVMARGVKAEKFDVKADNHTYLAQYNKLIDVAMNKQNWNGKPLQYGDDGCTDNNYSMVTIILPGKKAEAMYVRCWKPFFKR